MIQGWEQSRVGNDPEVGAIQGRGSESGSGLRITVGVSVFCGGVWGGGFPQQASALLRL